MRKLAIVAGALVASMAVSTSASAAAWCAWTDPYTYNCGFYTYQQCMATVSGAGGYCARNVNEPARPGAADERRPHRAYRGE